MSSDLRDLRKVADEVELEDYEDDDLPIDFDQFEEEEETAEKRPFLGMSPAERAIVAVFFFLNVIVIGAALLIATQRLG